MSEIKYLPVSDEVADLMIEGTALMDYSKITILAEMHTTRASKLYVKGNKLKEKAWKLAAEQLNLKERFEGEVGWGYSGMHQAIYKL